MMYARSYVFMCFPYVTIRSIIVLQSRDVGASMHTVWILPRTLVSSNCWLPRISDTP